MISRMERHLRSAEFVGGPKLGFAVDRFGHGGGDVGYIDRLQFGEPAADQWRGRRYPR